MSKASIRKLSFPSILNLFKVPSPTPDQLSFSDDSPVIDELSFLEDGQNSTDCANDSDLKDLVLLEDSSESFGIPANFSCPEILPPPELTEAELFGKIFELMTGGHGPPVPVKQHSVLPVNLTSEITVKCPIVGSDYYLWDLPNGQHLETEENTIGMLTKIINVGKPRG